MSDALRLFFALPLPGTAVDAMLAAQQRARPLASRLAPRWTTPEQMHVTLKFLGSMPPESLPRLLEISEARAGRAAPFDATLARVTAFGGRRARVLVVELSTESPVLAELAAGLEDDVAELGVARETRDFRPHVTLARFKHPGDARDVIDAAAIEPLPVRCEELRLYRSELTPAGSRYSVVSSSALGLERLQ